jgi:hypothetical protein
MERNLASKERNGKVVDAIGFDATLKRSFNNMQSSDDA